jgi:hypothetical protein
MNRARARRHARALSLLAFGLLALVTELGGRSLTHRIDIGRHVASPGDTQADYYPILLAAVKVGIALLLARLLWRVARAWTVERAGRRLLRARGASLSLTPPKVRLALSPRLWFAFFALTSVIYLVQVDAEGISAGRWPLLAPWLHTSALPAFAVLSVVAAVVWRAVQSWLADYESYAAATVAYAWSAAAAQPFRRARLPLAIDVPPRRLFGVAFESRPPPPPVPA